MHDGSCKMPPDRLATMPYKGFRASEAVAMHLLLIDDETGLRRTLWTTLESMRHQVADAATGAQAQELLGQQRFDLAFLDLRLGREKGLDLLPELLRAAPGLGVVVMTAFASIDSAVEAMRRGAFDYLPKPFTPTHPAACSAPCRWSGGCRTTLAAPPPRCEPRWPPSAPRCSRPRPRPTCPRRSRPCGRPWTWPSAWPRPRRPCCSAARTAPARGCWPEPSTPIARGPAGRSSPSTARACPP